MVTTKNQYVAEQVHSTYIATISQLKAVFNLLFAAQVTNFKKKDAKTLNRRMQWQINYLKLAFHFVQLDIITLKLNVFLGALFTNNINLMSQIEYVICLVNTSNKTNIIHWFFIKYKKVTKSILALELYIMVREFNIEGVINWTTNNIFNIKLLPMIVHTNSKLLYN